MIDFSNDRTGLDTELYPVVEDIIKILAEYGCTVGDAAHIGIRLSRIISANTKVNLSEIETV